MTAPWARQDMLVTAADQADRIGNLWNVFLAVLVGVFGVVLVLLAIALISRRPASEHGARRWITVGALLSTVVLLGLLVASMVTGKAMASEDQTLPLEVEVIGHQWWWELRYPGDQPTDRLVTASELHLPTGRPIHLLLRSGDVIHSLWIPSLHGKKDLIPGRNVDTWLHLDHPGVYRAQCAEFCGHQHAHMSLLVIAESPADFAAWRAHEAGDAAPPTDALEQRGKQVFEQGPCGSCHNLRGVQKASGITGPDLTHLASRRSLAAATLPLDREHLARWIRDPQKDKPGVYMPAIDLGDDDLNALVTYLEALR